MNNTAAAATTIDDLAMAIRENLRSAGMAATVPWCGGGTAAFTVTLSNGRTVRVLIENDDPMAEVFAR